MVISFETLPDWQRSRHPGLGCIDEVKEIQGRAVTGHKTDRESTRYAAKANKAAMADEAMANLSKRFAKRDEENGRK